MIELALRNIISTVRLRVNWGKIYSRLHNYRTSISGLAKTKYFCEIINVTPELLSKDVFIEVNSHPSLNDDNIIIDRVIGCDLLELKKKHLPIEHFITFKSIE